MPMQATRDTFRMTDTLTVKSFSGSEGRSRFRADAFRLRPVANTFNFTFTHHGVDQWVK